MNSFLVKLNKDKYWLEEEIEIQKKLKEYMNEGLTKVKRLTCEIKKLKQEYDGLYVENEQASKLYQSEYLSKFKSHHLLEKKKIFDKKKECKANGNQNDSLCDE